MSTHKSDNEGLPRLARRTTFPEPGKTMAQVDAELRAMVEAARPADEATPEQSDTPAEATEAQVAAEGLAAAITQPVQET
ncbi:MAG TPA: hypothetical protein VGO07_04570 [Candidatus Saccharimonadales bacterium]|jgi:hypothetical protein|nr:hypothetical protein [Candidatus Saccharimonadales bacterium]